ncbi:cytochrome c biogenesis CcdA family protein [Mycolicibacterium pyrenivorans]|uniref:cytochrome c biogenesis CcdA family protein n=1 Tax=Mycolicibacterium pyrenivorans TaxID=187102 RepID=UPI0021F31CE6|nr:cytochrome c biogenesis protein CcdA [Mycolicibacterium pyrenivorans]MCV7153071.1 cytochrome c biogenesis protein CcdA [Mycolicibacterium pyrenivorans]
MTGAGLAGALLGGLASLLSPCSALLLPSFFAYAFDRLGLLIRRTLAFWAGLCLVLVPLGAGVGAVGDALTRYRSEVTVIGGVVVIGFGLMTLLGKGFGSSAAQRLTGRITISTTLSVVVLGAVYGLAGFCAGPLLGGVLTMSAMGADPLYGGLLMGVYALGMAAPLFGLAFLWDRYDLGRKGWLRGRPVQVGPLHTHTTSLVTGTVLILIGALFVLTDGTAALNGVLGVDEQYDLQIWLSRVAAGVSDPGVALAVVAGLIVWRSTIVLRRRTRPRMPERESTSS